jgi:hypothetical protein
MRLWTGLAVVLLILVGAGTFWLGRATAGGPAHPDPYVVELVPGGAGVTYRIGSRTRLEPGVDYYLCPGGHTLCRRPR